MKFTKEKSIVAAKDSENKMQRMTNSFFIGSGVSTTISGVVTSESKLVLDEEGDEIDSVLAADSLKSLCSSSVVVLVD